MKFGLGLGLGRSSNNNASSAFDISTLNLSGGWDAPFSASPWSGISSAGNSGSRALSEATNPPSAGTTLNGYAPADFITNEKLENATALSSFGSSALSFAALVRVDTFAADDNFGGDVQPRIFGDTGSYFNLCISTSGAKLYVYDGAVKQTAYVALIAGTWTLLMGKWDGNNLYLTKNSVAFGAGVASGAPQLATGTLLVGCNYNATSFLDGAVARLLISPDNWGSTEFDGIRSSTNARYGLTL